jgi:hypothetical protein
MGEISREGYKLFAYLYGSEKEFEFFISQNSSVVYLVRDVGKGQFELEVKPLFSLGENKIITKKYYDLGIMVNDIVRLFEKLVDEPEKTLETLLGVRIPIKEVHANFHADLEEEEYNICENNETGTDIPSDD